MKKEKKSLSDFRDDIVSDTEFMYPEDKVKEFIEKRFEAIELEQKEAESRETKRALLNLKAKLEEDAGENLI